MKSTIIFNLLFLVLFSTASAQTDTLYRYYSSDMREVPKDSSYIYMKLYKKDNLWQGVGFRTQTNSLKFEGHYQDEAAKIPVGLFRQYKENGTFDYNIEYRNGVVISKQYFYKNGSKKSVISYSDGKVDEQMGWEENGKVIRNFVVEREARFKGGPEGWRRLLEKKLNANVAADAGAPAGQYTVKLQFIVDKEGYVSRVKAIEIPAGCKPCASEAVNVVSAGPQWEPAIQNNEPVIYQAIQFITFQVEETASKKKS